MENIKNNIELECSSCTERNTVNLSSDIKCKKCEKSLLGHFYKSIIIPTALVFASGIVGGMLVDDTININRASVKVEFNMMATCLKYINNDVEGCSCAVESMSGFIDANRARNSSWRKKELESRYIDCTD